MAIDRRKFEAKVDRSGEHLWRAATSAAGVGQIRVDGKLQTAPRVAWELAHGPLPVGSRVQSCPDEPACVRVEHLAVVGAPTAPRRASRRPAGSIRETAPGRWELSMTAGRYDDGNVRRVFRTVEASSDRAAGVTLASFITEVTATPQQSQKQDRVITVDAAVEQFLTEHLLGEKGREPKTVNDYRAAREGVRARDRHEADADYRRGDR